MATLSSLDRSGREAAEWFVSEANAMGAGVVVTSARRTKAEQAALIRAGVSQATRSRHLEGRAFDLGVPGYHWRDVDPAFWRWLGENWEQLGGRWGGRFRVSDPIHFDW